MDSNDRRGKSLYPTLMQSSKYVCMCMYVCVLESLWTTFNATCGRMASSAACAWREATQSRQHAGCLRPPGRRKRQRVKYECGNATIGYFKKWTLHCSWARFWPSQSKNEKQFPQEIILRRLRKQGSATETAVEETLLRGTLPLQSLSVAALIDLSIYFTTQVQRSWVHENALSIKILSTRNIKGPEQT